MKIANKKLFGGELGGLGGGDNKATIYDEQNDLSKRLFFFYPSADGGASLSLSTLSPRLTLCEWARGILIVTSSLDNPKQLLP